jgi:hypothetical protein
MITGVVQMVEHLFCKSKALSSNMSHQKKKKEKRKRKEWLLAIIANHCSNCSAYIN